MGYGDFWFIDKRVQTKNLLRWFIYAVLLFSFVSIGVTVGIKSLYSPFTNYKIEENTLHITVNETKKTNANGYVKGYVTNTGSYAPEGKYIKAEFYTKNNINIGNEYIEIESLPPQYKQVFEIKFRYSNVDRMYLKIVDNKE